MPYTFNPFTGKLDYFQAGSTYSNEEAQDAVGSILTDSSTIDFTYDDGTPSITAAVIAAGVDHNSLANLTTGDPHTQYTKDPGTVVDKEITIWSGTGGRDFATSSGVQIGASTSTQITPTASNTNLLLDGNGTGVVQFNTGSNSMQFPKTRPGSISSPYLTISPSTGNMSWNSLVFPVTDWQYVYDTAGGASGQFFTVSNASGDGLRILDAATPITGVMFAVRNNAESEEYFYVDSEKIYTENHAEVGNPGLESAGVNIGGTVLELGLRVNDIGGGREGQIMMHRHSTLYGSIIIGSRANSDTTSHADVANSMDLVGLRGCGWAGSNYKIFGQILINSDASGTISNTSAPGSITFSTTQDGATTPTLGMTLDREQRLTVQGIIDAQSDVVVNANSILLGSTSQALIKYDGTNLVLNPAVSGSGYVFIGDGTTPANIQASQIGLGTDAPSSARIITATASSTAISTGMQLSLTYSGAVSGMRAMNFQGIHSGSNTNPSCTSLFTSTNTVNPSGTVTMIGVQPTAASGVASTQGTKLYEAVRAAVTDVGGHSGGTIRAYGLRVLVMPAFTGAGTITTWGINCDDDIQLSTDKKLLFEGSATVKGDTYMTWNATSLNTFINGTNAIQTTATQTGVIAGSSTSYAKVGGVIDVNTTQVGNVGAGEDDLITYTIPANVLNTNGDQIRFRMAGTFAANANNKRVRIKYGATTLLDTTALAFNNADWTAHGTIVRTGATTQKAICEFASGSALLTSSCDYTAPAETLSGTVVLKATGEATSNNDITEEFHIVEWIPNE